MSRGRGSFRGKKGFPDEMKPNGPKIGYLSEDVMAYYRNVSSTLEGGGAFDDDPVLEEQFLKNVYTTLKDEAIQVSQNQTVSRILEMLFSHSQPYHMHDLFCQFSKELSIVTFDRFASHVFQSLISYLPAIYENKDEVEKNQGQSSNLHTSVEQVCKFMESHMRDIMTHTYASHVLRSFLEALGGVPVKEEVVRSRVSRNQRKAETVGPAKFSYKALSRDFKSSFELLTDKLMKLCNYEDHLADSNYCPVLQTVLLTLHKTSPEAYNELSNTIIEKTCTMTESAESAPDDVTKKIPDIVQNEIGSYLIELLITLADKKKLKELYKLLFKDKLIYFAAHPIANYVLQKLLTVVDSKMFQKILADITQYMEDILAVNHIGVITKLAEACCRTNSAQEEFLEALMAAFHCKTPETRKSKIVPLLASLQTYEMFYKEDSSQGDGTSRSLLKTVNFHGSLILQQVFNFTNTKLVASSLTSLSPTEIAGLCCDKCGSHVIDVFFQSETIPDKIKSSCIKNLQGVYINIACNRSGSRCLENIWKCCSLNQKTLIAEDLSKHQERLEGDQWGRYLYANFAISKFVQRRKEWAEIQGANAKKQQILQEILQGNAGKKKRKQKSGVTEAAQVEESPTESLSIDTKTKKRKQETNDSTSKNSFKKTKLGTQDNPADEEEVHPKTQSEETKLKKRQRRKEKQRVVRNVDTDDSAAATGGSKKKKSSEKTNVNSKTLDEDISQVKKDKSGKKKKLKK
ncbi:nucleolar protein 9-like isoform X2 [Physella acuta]|uniref:nucleolar protein 9-like isoform X2 n=1 Tax=Physella acuta TaxID=109671 RepID=UPI0027DC7461|nr:nucleolar protein 9-like isoform X2 [Physella acuta]